MGFVVTCSLREMPLACGLSFALLYLVNYDVWVLPLACLFRSKGQPTGKQYVVPLLILLPEMSTFLFCFRNIFSYLLTLSDASYASFRNLYFCVVSVKTSLVVFVDELRAVAIFESRIG